MCKKGMKRGQQQPTRLNRPPEVFHLQNLDLRLNRQPKEPPKRYDCGIRNPKDLSIKMQSETAQTLLKNGNIFKDSADEK